ncbi:uncharacterized protein LOC135373188 [Ornithodoros turicata]|uniref:uncharacterized protein LOC135373188 n=1 Tax=Ornithodoros turicata TaxID=34597 RepID=UPI003139C3D7
MLRLCPQTSHALPLLVDHGSMVEYCSSLPPDIQCQRQERQAASSHSSYPGSPRSGRFSTGQPAAERASVHEVMPQSDFQRQVLRILHIMRLAQQEQGDLLHEVSRQLVHSDPIVAEAPLVPTPFASCEALVDFNDSLNEHMETRLVEELAQLGGSEVRQSTRKILEYLLTDYVAAEFSWLGQKGKRKFGQLKLPHLIIRAVRKNIRLSAATRYEVESEIKTWLRHAKERCTSQRALTDHAPSQQD